MSLVPRNDVAQARMSSVAEITPFRPPAKKSTHIPSPLTPAHGENVPVLGRNCTPVADADPNAGPLRIDLETESDSSLDETMPPMQNATMAQHPPLLSRPVLASTQSPHNRGLALEAIENRTEALSVPRDQLLRDARAVVKTGGTRIVLSGTWKRTPRVNRDDDTILDPMHVTSPNDLQEVNDRLETAFKLLTDLEKAGEKYCQVLQKLRPLLHEISDTRTRTDARRGSDLVTQCSALLELKTHAASALRSGMGGLDRVEKLAIDRICSFVGKRGSENGGEANQGGFN